MSSYLLEISLSLESASTPLSACMYECYNSAHAYWLRLIDWLGPAYYEKASNAFKQENYEIQLQIGRLLIDQRT